MKKKLNSKIVLNKKFDIELSGYNAKQVDTYLDLILEDYKSFEQEIEILKDKLEEKMAILSTKDEKIENLKLEIENQKDQIDNINKNTTPELTKVISELNKKIPELNKKIDNLKK
jgi:DivIVA domain-containing protein